MNKDIKLGLIISFFSAIIFGLYPPLIKLSLLDGANSTLTITFSTFIRALLLVCVSLYHKHKILPDDETKMAYLSGGFFQALSIIGILSSLSFIPGPVTIVILFTHTIILLFYLAWTGEQKLNLNSCISTGMAIFGVSLVVNLWQTEGESLNIYGILLAILASFATASRLYVFGKQVKETNPALVGARIFSVSFIFTLLLILLSPPTLPSTSYGYIFLILASLVYSIGTFGMFYGISYLGSFRFALLIKLEPIFTALFSYLILKETLLPIQYLGMAIVIISLVSYQIFEERKPIKT